MATTRTFIAIQLASNICERAHELIGRLQESGADVKWVDRDQLHVTLKFLGDITDQEIAWVCRRVDQVCSQIAPFDIHCRGVGAFPNTEKPRVVWLGLDEGAEQVYALQEALEEALADGRFPRETRRFHPHLTLGRVKRGSSDLADRVGKYDRYDAGGCAVSEVRVYASELERRGPTYTVLSRSPLGSTRMASDEDE